MAKKLLMALVAVVAVAGGIAALSAYEAHVINVTAHIENALSVPTTPIIFGTVFPQEMVTNDFTMGLSTSFLAQSRVNAVDYKIVQKPKCICISSEYTNQTLCPKGKYAPVDYATDLCPALYHQMESLCPFLSKTTTDANDTSHPSYFIDPTPAAPNSGDEHCNQPVRYTSSVLHYSNTGWAGWSCPLDKYAVGGGVIENAYPMGAQGIAQPGATIDGSTYPVFPHYTFGAGETGYVAQNGGTAQTARIYVDCLAIVPDAKGVLLKTTDETDSWTVDLKVPPVAGYVGQDWPAGCPTVPTNDVDYGCDLWIEVTGIGIPQ